MNTHFEFNGLTTALLLLCIFPVGCVSRCPHPEQIPAEAAKREALGRWGWKGVEVSSARFKDGSWVIGLSRLPKTPGGHATVEVSEDGKVLHTQPGR